MVNVREFWFLCAGLAGVFASWGLVADRNAAEWRMLTSLLLLLFSSLILCVLGLDAVGGFK